MSPVMDGADTGAEEEMEAVDRVDVPAAVAADAAANLMPDSSALQLDFNKPPIEEIQPIDGDTHPPVQMFESGPDPADFQRAFMDQGGAATAQDGGTDNLIIPPDNGDAGYGGADRFEPAVEDLTPQMPAFDQGAAGRDMEAQNLDNLIIPPPDNASGGAAPDVAMEQSSPVADVVTPVISPDMAAIDEEERS